ncbi:hypothetical protein [Streptosporangium sp. NBC_01469]|uniref:hypothetical protein n=1 Tax=Streptosporangium sp. NBC_01469 TaxID=2903898 RepID=UPI0032522352
MPLVPLEQVTEEHFGILFGINVRGTLFTVQKALPLLNEGASVILNGSTNMDVGDEALGVYAAKSPPPASLTNTTASPDAAPVDGSTLRLAVASGSPGPHGW